MRLALCLLVCSFGGAPAQAQAPDKARSAAAYTEGQRRYAAHDYAAAAAKFIEAYAAEPDPAYLFNVAQSFRLAHDCVEAASYYRRFLADVTSAPNLDKVHVYLDEMDACIKRQKPAPPPTPPAPPTTPPVASPRPPMVSGDPGATKRDIGLALGGLGLVAVGVGVWFHRDVGYFEQKTRSCTTDRPCTTGELAHWTDRGHAASSAAIASYSVGGAALISGCLLYLLGRSDSKEQAVAAVPIHGGALVTARLAF